jgi:hypothetical protein
MACARVTGVVSAGLPRAAQRAIAPNHARRLIAFALLYHPHLLKNCLVFGSASLQPNTCSDGHTRSMIDGCNLCAACPWPEPSQHRCHLSIAAGRMHRACSWPWTPSPHPPGSLGRQQSCQLPWHATAWWGDAGGGRPEPHQQRPLPPQQSYTGLLIRPDIR